MHAKNFSLLHPARLTGAAALLLLTLSPAAGAAVTDELPKFESYIKVTGHAADIRGNDAAFQKRARTHADGAAGIEDLHIYKDLDKRTALLIDGRALVGPEDYLGQFKLTRTNLGSFEAGYKRTRTFYDGIGGFFPTNRAWYPLVEEDLHLDRGRFWVEAKLALKDAPVVTLRYVNETRSGKKDSTIWGDSNLTGLPLVPANNATRKILPAYLGLDERHEALEAQGEFHFGKTSVNVKLLRDWTNNLDRFYVTNFKGEGATERVVQQANGIATRSTGAIVTSETPLSATLTFNAGLSYHKLTSSLNGERATAVGLIPTFAFKDLSGGSDMKVYTANASLGWKPNAAWQLQACLRADDEYTKSAATFVSITQPRNSPITAPITTATNNESSRVKEKILTPEVTFRYTGLKRVVIYGAFSDRINDGDDRLVSPYATATPALTNLFNQTYTQDQAHYTLGSNINASSALVLRGEVFHKDHENKFTGYANHLGGLYVVGYQFTGLKLTAIVKPVPQLSFSTRYQPQTGKMQVTTEATSRFDSMDAQSHLIGETINWNPNKFVYLQANLNLVYNYISTAYPRAGGLGNLRGQNSDNNVRTVSFITGFVVDKNTDAAIEYVYQKADNYVPEQAVGTQPYGAGYKEYSVSVGVKHRFSNRWIGSAKIGYVESRNDTTGGNTNFRGPLAYLAVEHGL
jgi:hypothetical protein